MTVYALSLLLAVSAFSILHALKLNTENADKQRRLNHLIHTGDIDGYEFGFMYAVKNGQEIRLTRRDVQFYAENPSTDSQTFILEFSSGDRLHMSLKKRAVLSAGAQVVENFHNRRETSFLEARDCVFSGHVGEIQRGDLASLSVCDGNLMGSVMTPERHYDVMTDSSARGQRSMEMRVLVTWTNAERMRRASKNDTDRSQENDEIIPKDNTLDNAKPSPLAKYRTAAVEVAVYLISAYLKRVKEVLGLSTREELVNLIVLKWSGVAASYSDEHQVGWNLTIKLKLIEIWRKDPAWFDSKATKLGKHLGSICKGTKKLPYDHIAVMSSGTIEKPHGLAFVGGVCNPKNRCSAIKSARYTFMTEAHELGHSLGLGHDSGNMKCQASKKGFMSASDMFFLDCYRIRLDKSLPKKGCLFIENVPARGKKENYVITPQYPAQKMGFDGQCKSRYGPEFEYTAYPGYSVCQRYGCLAVDPTGKNYGQLTDKTAFIATPCGHEKMCNGKNCIPWNGTAISTHIARMYVVQGGWSEWSEYSPCDHSCGYPVQVSIRKCNTPEPKMAPFCDGKMYKAKLCQPKPECAKQEKPDSVLVSQSANDTCTRLKVTQPNITGNGRVVDKCIVECQLNKGGYVGKYIIHDGTPCTGKDKSKDNSLRGVSWLCVRGQCMEFGCDGNTLGDAGGKEKDKCGVCGGDNSTCGKRSKIKEK